MCVFFRVRDRVDFWFGQLFYLMGVAVMGKKWAKYS